MCQCIRFDVLGSGTVSEGKMDSRKEQRPVGLVRVESFGGLERFQVPVVSPHNEWIGSTFQ